MTQYAGTYGNAQFGALALNAVSWDCDSTSTEIDTTTKGSSGYHNFIFGKRTASGKCTCVFDSTIHRASMSVLKNGSTGNLKLYVYEGDDKYGAFPVGITDVKLDSSMDEYVKVEFNWKANAAYSLPGETAVF